MVLPRGNNRLVAFSLALALLGVVLLGALPHQVSAVKKMEPMESKDLEWSEGVAIEETRKDIGRLLEAYDEARPELVEILEGFKEHRIKDYGIRKLPLWGISLARVHDLPGRESERDIYMRMVDIAEMLLTVYTEEHAYIEDRVMRGWPMVVDLRDKTAQHEAYNFGHIGMALGEAARAAADNGDHLLAVRYVEPVLAALWDGFLTDDLEMTKLDEQGRVVYIPEGASKGRKRRQIKNTAGSQDKCVDKPQAYNHGLLAARAAIAVDNALKRIDWDVVEWPMEEWKTRKACHKDLERFITQNAMWLRDAFEAQPPAGTDERDQYTGPPGQVWYQWSYRDLAECPSLQGSTKDRLEDIAHASFEVNFVAEVRHWTELQGLKHVFKNKDVHRLMVTFLNRIVHDYDAPGKKRFACDVAGVFDGDDWGNMEKQCYAPFRVVEKRPNHALGWLNFVHTARDQIDNDKVIRCDAMQMAKLTLPLAVPGTKEFYKQQFGAMDHFWTADAIVGKYHFYNFKQVLKNDCVPEDEPAAAGDEADDDKVKDKKKSKDKKTKKSKDKEKKPKAKETSAPKLVEAKAVEFTSPAPGSWGMPHPSAGATAAAPQEEAQAP